MRAGFGRVGGATFPFDRDTAYRTLIDCGQLQPEETVLVLGCAGGAGSAAIQIAGAARVRTRHAADERDPRGRRARMARAPDAGPGRSARSVTASARAARRTARPANHARMRTQAARGAQVGGAQTGRSNGHGREGADPRRQPGGAQLSR
ncbi:MAG TPA: hypothetical protein PLZ50_03480, partial [Rubrivivax sp.]|nr:hypothetical protein [Rubrivivax sp.]